MTTAIVVGAGAVIALALACYCLARSLTRLAREIAFTRVVAGQARDESSRIGVTADRIRQALS